MVSLSPLYIEEVKYLEKRGKIQVNFRKGEEKISYVEEFYPYISLGGLPRILKRDLTKILPSKLKVKVVEDRIYAKRFSELIKAGNLIAKFFRKQVLLLEPERQFLIEKGWDYFQRFSSELNALNKPILPREYLSIEVIALSNLLKLHPEKIVPIIDNEFEMLEILLENEFFKYGYGILGISKGGIPLYELSMWKKDLYFKIKEKNLGIENIKCSCCKGRSKSSIAKVEILKDGCYLAEPCSKTFSKKFHKQNANKKARMIMKRDFYLKSYPIGPFKAGEKVELLLCDAQKLQESNCAKILSVEENWFCKKEESILVKIVKKLMEKRKSIAKEKRGIKAVSVSKAGLFCENVLQENAYYSLLNAINKYLDRMLFLLPLHICNQASKFYNELIAYELGF